MSWVAVSECLIHTEPNAPLIALKLSSAFLPGKRSFPSTESWLNVVKLPTFLGNKGPWRPNAITSGGTNHNYGFVLLLFIK